MPRPYTSWGRTGAEQDVDARVKGSVSA